MIAFSGSNANPNHIPKPAPDRYGPLITVGCGGSCRWRLQSNRSPA